MARLLPSTPEGLNVEQTEILAQTGLVRVPAAVPIADIEAMVDALWVRLERRCGARRDRPETWTTERPAQLGAKTDAFAAMASPQVRAILDQQLGRWVAPTRWGMPLVTFPMRNTRWETPHRHWHLDVPADAATPSVARLFTVLATSAPRGGGTAYVAGSHLLARRAAQSAGRHLSSAETRAALKSRYQWFADLESTRTNEDREARFMAEATSVDDVPLQVREMLGEPGDLLVMDPLTLHAMTVNARETPRMMLTQWINGA